VGSSFGSSRSFVNSSRISLGGKVFNLYLFRSIIIGYSYWFFVDFLEEIAEFNQATMKTVNIHQAKIDRVKFDGTNNFRKGKEDIVKTNNRQ